jgi:hypothetical protein
MKFINMQQLKDTAKGVYYRLLPYFIRPSNEDIQIVVSSPGGSGTSMLIKFLSDHEIETNHPHNGDKLKHIFRPLYRRFKSVRVVYIIGNPIEITLSLLNRNFFRIHCSIHGQLLIPPKNQISLETLIDSKRDLLNLNKLFKNWTNKRLHHNKCLVIDFDHLWDNMDILLDFCGVLDRKETFPKKRERNSKVDTLTNEELQKLRGKYKQAMGIRQRVIDNGGYLLFN